MVPGPVSDDWDDTVTEGAELCEEGRAQERWADDESFHQRGHYLSVSAAVTYGNGQLVSFFIHIHFLFV